MRFVTGVLVWLFAVGSMAAVAMAAGSGEGVRHVADKAVLDALFIRLKGADSAADAQAVAGEIWQEWLKTDNAEVRKRLGVVQMAQRAGDADGALKELDRIVAIAPDFAEGWNQRATLLFVLGRDAESVNDIAEVLRLEPRHFGALAGLGLIHMRAENWKSAIASFERALAVHPFLGERALIPELRKKLAGEKL